MGKNRWVPGAVEEKRGRIWRICPEAKHYVDLRGNETKHCDTHSTAQTQSTTRLLIDSLVTDREEQSFLFFRGEVRN